jgi:leader peptidase (prepilin peptidase)/N-methyltransferase
MLTLLANNPAAFVAFSVFIGLVVGSFLNVVIYRLPIMMERDWKRQCAELESGIPETTGSRQENVFNLVWPGSRCTHCGHTIRAWENIPVLSYLFLRGKCSQCHASISIRYPAIEILTALLSGASAWHFGFTIAGLSSILLGWGLIALAFIDYDHQILPDVITLPLLWLGLIINIENTFIPLQSAVIGVVVAYVFLWLVFQLFKLVTGKEGMGFGDFKLFALFGAWLGWQQLPLTIILASATGAIVGLFMIIIAGRDRQLPIPFGPFLCVAGWISLFWGNQILGRYLQLFHVSSF